LAAGECCKEVMIRKIRLYDLVIYLYNPAELPGV